MPQVIRQHIHQFAPVFSDRHHRRIGLLGGSFNPAHDGHAHIADMAAEQLGLDAIWWLVSPQNPLKSDRDMAGFDVRFNSAVAMAKTCKYAAKMHVSSLEKSLGFQHTVMTLDLIKKHMPKSHLVWIMGADNLASFHQWHQPQMITRKMAMAVVNRPGAVAAALSSRGAKMAGTRLTPRRLAARGFPPKTWAFL